MSRHRQITDLSRRTPDRMSGRGAISGTAQISTGMYWIQFKNMERWPSGLRRTPGKCVYAKHVPRVRIPLSPPKLKCPPCVGILILHRRLFEPSEYYSWVRKILQDRKILMCASTNPEGVSLQDVGE